MIKRYLSTLLVLLNLAMGAGLAYLWLNKQGHIRNIHWLAPAAQNPLLTAPPLPSPAWNETDVSRFLAIVDRPLFSPSRRPPPPPPPLPPPPVVDPLDSVQLYGIFASENSGGIVARIEGKVRRVQYKEKIGEWTLKSAKDRDITLERGTQIRVLNLAYVRAPAPPPKTTPIPTPATVPVQPKAEAPPSDGTRAQLMQQEERERVRVLNEFRAKVGAPLLPMP